MGQQQQKDLQGSQYLSAPSGQYGVGYQDFHWINKSVCPDPFFSGAAGDHGNQADFSPNNQSHYCREIMTRVYYPSYSHQQGSPYYPPLIKQWQAALSAANIPGVTSQMIATLSNIKTYTAENLPLVNDKKFPIIIFAGGIGSVAQNYEGFIDDVVSHGYIVVSVNNTFIGGPIQFPDGHVVNYVANFTEKQDTAATISDIDYTYNKIHDLHNQNPLFTAMDLQHIGLFGHSNGAYFTVMLAHQHPDWFQAAAALDAPGLPYLPEIVEGFAIPFMHIHAAEWRERYSVHYAHIGAFHLTKNEYYIVLTSDLENINYSRHNNFSDMSTLQYQPVVEDFSNYEIEQGNLWPLDVGTIDGHQAVHTADEYLVQFFDTFLKGKHSATFMNCIHLGNSRMTCGPGQTSE